MPIKAYDMSCDVDISVVHVEVSMACMKQRPRNLDWAHGEVGAKKNHDAVIPIPEAFVNKVKALGGKLGGAFGVLVFPSTKDRNVAVSAERTTTAALRQMGWHTAGVTTPSVSSGLAPLVVLV